VATKIVDGKMVFDFVESKAQGADCKNCPLIRRRLAFPESLMNSDDQTQIMFVGEGPGRDEAQRQKVYQGPSGAILRAAITGANLEQFGVRLSNAVLCDPRAVKASDRDSKEVQKRKKELFDQAVKACSGRLRAEIAAVDPELLVVMGNEAKAAVTPKQTGGILKLSGTFSKHDGRDVMYLFHPAWLLHAQVGERHFTEFQDHVKEAALFFQAKAFKYQVRVAESPEDIDLFLAELENQERVALDAETTSLSPWQDGIERNPPATAEQRKVAKENGYELRSGLAYELGQLICVQLCGDDKETGYVLPWEHLQHRREEFSAFLKRANIGCHNAQFDMMWMMLFFGVSNFVFCTLLKSYATDESTAHSLKRLGRRYLGIEDWSAELALWTDSIDNQIDVSFDNVPRALLYKYGAIDVVTTRIIDDLIELNPNERRHYEEFLLPLSNAGVRRTVRGVMVDIKTLAENATLLRRHLNDVNARLLSDFGLENSNSPKQVIGVLEGNRSRDFGIEIPIDPTSGDKYGTGAKAADRGKGWFASLQRDGDRDAFEEIEWRLSEYSKLIETSRGLRRAIDTNLVDLQRSYSDREIEIIDGRPVSFLHPDVMLWATVTGRVNFRRPTVTNYPVHTNYSEAIRAPCKARPGYVWVHYDFKQFELRVYACLTGDKGMRDVLFTKDDRGEPADPHGIVAVEIYGNEYFALNERTNGKTRRDVKECVFGKLFRRTNGAIAKALELPLSRVDVICEVITGMFPYLQEYWDWIEEQLIKNREIVSVLQHTRRFPMLTDENWNRSFNQAVNFPIQNTASGLNLLSLLACEQAYPDSVFPFWTIHDSGDMEVLSEVWDAESEKMIYILENHPRQYFRDLDVPFSYTDDIPMLVDVHVSDHWTAA